MSNDLERRYRHLEITGDEIGYNRCIQFLRSIHQYPGAISYVREVTITGGPDQSTFAGEMPWIITYAPLHRFLLELAEQDRIETFTFSAIYEWAHFPEMFRQAIMCIFVGARIQRVSLSHLVSVPKDCFVALSRRVTALRLLDVAIDSTPAQATDHGAYHLVDLVLEDMDGDSIRVLLDAMTPYVRRLGKSIRSFPRLINLTIGLTDEENLGACCALIEATYLTLQVFRWDYPNHQFPELPLSTYPISLKNHRQLQRIVYTVPDINDAHVYHSDPFEGLIRLLESVNPESNNFVELELKLFCPHFSKIRDSVNGYDGWARLGGLLHNDYFRRLQGVNIEVFVLDPRTRSEIQHGVDRQRVSLSQRKGELMGLLQARLPYLASRQMISVDLDVPNPNARGSRNLHRLPPRYPNNQ